MTRSFPSMLPPGLQIPQRWPGWTDVLSSDDARRSLTLARDVASRMSDLHSVESAAAAARRQTAFPRSTHWKDQSTSQGFAGLAVFFAAFDACFPDEGWDQVGHQCLAAAVRAAERQKTPVVGLASGLAGLGFAAWMLSRGGRRYSRLLAALDDAVVPGAISLSQRVDSHRTGCPVGDIDVISGLSGVAAYLLCRRDRPAPARALERVLDSLTRLLADGAEPPRWHTPASLLFDDEVRRRYPDGNLNCGLAHGLPGLLAVVAIATLAGVRAPDAVDALRAGADWLARNRLEDGWGVTWPTAIPVAPGEAANRQLPSRTAWCYGGPGVARALWLTGEAIDDDRYRELAVAAMDAAIGRPVVARRINSPTFCHGVAGLLQVVLRFAHDTGITAFSSAATALARQLHELHEPDSLLGYRNLEPGGRRIDQPGLLDGAPGPALALLAASTHVEPAWDRLFVLS